MIAVNGVVNWRGNRLPELQELVSLFFSSEAIAIVAIESKVSSLWDLSNDFGEVKEIGFSP
jgi:hypothetical protein